MTDSIILASDHGAFVYYDDVIIRGISFVADKTLGGLFDSFFIAPEMATKFVSGEFDHTHWFVQHSGDRIALYNNTNIVLNDLGQSLELLEYLTPDHLSLSIKIYREIGQIRFSLSRDVKFTSRIPYIDFVITQHNDMSAVLEIVRISLHELLDQRRISRSITCDLSKPFDVCTRRLFSSYSLCYAEPDERFLIPLPRGHFVDLVRFGREPLTAGLQATVDRSTNMLRLSVIGTEAAYDRPMKSMKLLFSRPHDPSLLLYGVSVPIDELGDGIELELPSILDQPFDLWAPLLYRQVSLVG